jgi:effector-binding domain-containing protein
LTMDVKEKKTLKLSNVVLHKVNVEELQKLSAEKIVKLLNAHLRLKGAVPKGPLINHTYLRNGENQVSFMLQASKAVDVEAPYGFNDSLRVENCLYTRFQGKEYDIDYAYQKMNLYAYENNLSLKKESYSIFLANEPGSDKVTIDIFMPIK